jgi:hypothetical protein
MASRHRKAASETREVGQELVNQILEHQAAEPTAIDFAKFELIQVHRRDLKKADFYAKEISDRSQVRLRRGIKKQGLLRPIVWNRRTGFVIDGWATIAACDDRQGSEDYRLPVCVLDLDKKQEREAHILLNNPEAQGFLALEPLAKLFKDTDTILDITSTGYDVADVYRLFGDSPFAAEGRKQELGELADDIREKFRQYNERTAKLSAAQQDDFFTVFVFQTGDEQKESHTALGLDDNRWQNGREFAAKVLLVLRRLQMYEPNVTLANVSVDETEDSTSVGVQHLDKQLATVNATPEKWGSPEALERQTLLLLETRAVLLAIDIDVRREFALYVHGTIDNATSAPLWTQLAATSRNEELPMRLGIFRDTMIKRMNAVVEARVTT